ncbi:restriction endonuclease subunit S [Bhargavaea massiliensis]
MFSKYQDKKVLRSLQKNPNWKLLKFSDVLRDETKNAKKIKKEEYLAQGSYPIIDQGKDYIAGFTNDREGVYDKSPLIIFGDHTRILKYIDFPIFIGADGVKLLKNVFSEEEVLTKYIYYYLRTVNIPDTGYNRHFKFLKEVVIPIPNIYLQERIVFVLDKAQELIDKRKAQIAALDQMAQSVFLEMFGDPVKNNKNWVMQKLSETGELKRGISKHRPRNAPELLNGPYPLIQTGDIANSGIFIKKYNQTYSELGLKQSKMWPKGTLCITIAANIAQTGILTFDACFPDSVVAYIPKNYMSNIYVHFWFTFLQRIIEANAPESAQKNINLKILSELEIPVPPVELQNKFAEIVQKIESQKDLLQKSLEELENNFNSLMQRAFKGELFND